MTQVSKFLLRNDVWERIFDIFSDTFVSIKEKNKLNKFLDKFLTPTERIMLAKRLSIAVLLAKGCDYATIRRVLRVTPSTISRISFHYRYESEGLGPVIEEILKKDAFKIFWEQLKDLIDFPIKGQPLSELEKRSAERKRRIYSLKSELG